MLAPTLPTGFWSWTSSTAAAATIGLVCASITVTPAVDADKPVVTPAVKGNADLEKC